MEYVTKGMSWQSQRQSTSKGNRARKRYDNARLPLSGFPMPPHKFTYDEIVAYYSQPRVQCLLCGRTFCSMAKHLTFIHNVSVQEYKNMYGLPKKRGLTGTYASAAHQAAAIRRLQDPDDPAYKYFNDATIREETRKKAVVASQHQDCQPFRIELANRHRPKGKEE